MAHLLTPGQRRALTDEVRRIYGELAGRPHGRDCISRTDCCRFRLTGRTPFLTRGEAAVAAMATRASGRKKIAASPDGSCPLLGADGRCTIYEDRPFGCRTHFCKSAGGPMDRRDVRDLIQRLDDIDVKLGGDGAVNLPAALQRALTELAAAPRRS